ncbi:MAG TPA: hypothetical protein VJ571_01740 [Candidatus Nitrosotalea sp.]|nr:hypothetical protein [Candidatus Nitrosotalea sp.]
MTVNPKKTSTMTFRIDEDVLNKLRSESEHRETSLNTFVNHIFKRYVEWDMYEAKVGMIPIAKPIILELFGNLTKDHVVDMATRIGKNVVRDTALFMRGDFNLNSFISWFEARMRASSIEINHNIKDNAHTFIIKHDLGENWSLYHTTVLGLIFREVLETTIDFEYNAGMMSFKFVE